VFFSFFLFFFANSRRFPFFESEDSRSSFSPSGRKEHRILDVLSRDVPSNRAAPLPRPRPLQRHPPCLPSPLLKVGNCLFPVFPLSILRRAGVDYSFPPPSLLHIRMLREDAPSPSSVFLFLFLLLSFCGPLPDDLSGNRPASPRFIPLLA